MNPAIRSALQRGLVIPALPLALNANRKWDERRQRALLRYYFAASAGGVAVGVHTTQFTIRDPHIGLFQPLLKLASEEFSRADVTRGEPLVRVCGICGPTAQATGEAHFAAEAGYHAGLLSLAALKSATDDELIAHCRAVAEVIPVIGFYLQPSVGGRALPYSFWRRFAEIENVVAIKMAPFNRYQTLDVVRAILESGREDIALYTGNDDNIVIDLLTPFRFQVDGEWRTRRIVGGLLGHWAVWTQKAAELLNQCHMLTLKNQPVDQDILTLAQQVTDSNAAFFDAANGYHGCIAGIHEVLRRQGLLEGIWCLDPHESLSHGQQKEIDRVYAAYPQLNDDEFVRENLGKWQA
ncbi:MAG TPA: dihydrodipicolinate synthase family protein [Verrucomicrobiae bacterium]